MKFGPLEDTFVTSKILQPQYIYFLKKPFLEKIDDLQIKCFDQ